MKKNKIIIPALLFVLAAASVTPFLFAQAATTPDSSNGYATSSVQRMKNFVGLKNKVRNHPKLSATQIAAQKETQTAKIAAIKSALESNNYDAWVAAMAAMNNGTSTNPNTKVNTLTQKITRDNFPKLVEAYNLEKQAQADLTALGINNIKGNGMEFGLGLGMMGLWK